MRKRNQARGKKVKLNCRRKRSLAQENRSIKEILRSSNSSVRSLLVDSDATRNYIDLLG